MCDPISLAVTSAALGIGQAASQFQGEQNAHKSNEVAANLNYAQQFNTEQAKATQIDANTSATSFDSAITAAQAKGRIAASAADSGMGGSSLTQNLNASLFGIGRQDSVSQFNDQSQRNQLGSDLTGAEISRRAQIARVPNPTGASLVLGIGKGVMSGFSTYAGAGGSLPGTAA